MCVFCFQVHIRGASIKSLSLLYHHPSSFATIHSPSPIDAIRTTSIRKVPNNMLGTEKIEKKIRRLSWIGQRPAEEDVASKNTVVVVDSGSWTIHAPKEFVWEIIRSTQPECIR